MWILCENEPMVLLGYPKRSGMDWPTVLVLPSANHERRNGRKRKSTGGGVLTPTGARPVRTYDARETFTLSPARHRSLIAEAAKACWHAGAGGLAREGSGIPQYSSTMASRAGCLNTTNCVLGRMGIVNTFDNQNHSHDELYSGVRNAATASVYVYSIDNLDSTHYQS